MAPVEPAAFLVACVRAAWAPRASELIESDLEARDDHAGPPAPPPQARALYAAAVEFIEPLPLPRGLDSRSLRRRGLQIAVVLGTVAAGAVLAPGLGDIRRRLEGAQPGWLAVAVVLELLSCLSYVLMFRPKAGVPAHEVARRTVAFFVLKSAVNFVAVVVIGVAMWLGVGPQVSPGLTLLP